MRTALLHIIIFTVNFQIWAQYSSINPELPDKRIEHSIFLIGDTGYPDHENQHNNYTLRAINTEIERLDHPSSLIYLGDNICPKGLPVEPGKERNFAISILDAQLEVVRDYPGNVFFIPGNYDWNNSGRRGNEYVRLQEEYIESYFPDKTNIQFVPDQACGGPVVRGDRQRSCFDIY